MSRRPMVALVSAVLLAACGATSTSQGGAASAAPSTAPSTAPSSGPSAPSSVAASASQAATASGGGGELASVTLHIDGGAKAGDYSATIRTGGCSRGTFGENTFAVSSVEVTSDGGFDGPQMTIFDAAAAASGTDQFGVGLVFDNYATNLLMSPYEGFGSGTLTLVDRGSTATIHAEGTLEDGSAATLDIECHSVTGL